MVPAALTTPVTLHFVHALLPTMEAVARQRYVFQGRVRMVVRAHPVLAAVLHVSAFLASLVLLVKLTSISALLMCV